jgi:lipid-binding SYLF domain-containing protein
MTQMSTGRLTLTVCGALAVLMLSPAWAETPKSLTPAEEADHHVVMAEKTFQDFVADPSQDYFRKLLAKAQGVLIIPVSARVAFIFGGQGGRGVLVARDPAGKWIGPAFYTLSYASVGLQIGVQVSEVIVVVMTQSAINSLLSSAVRGGVDATMAAGPVGTGTQTSFQGDFISVYRSKVLYGGLNLDGTVMSANDTWNAGFYGKPTTAVDILVRHEASSPKGEGLLNAVSDAAAEAVQAAATQPKTEKK